VVAVSALIALAAVLILLYALPGARGRRRARGIPCARTKGYEFTASGHFVREIGTLGSFTGIHGLAVDPSSGEIWVADHLPVQQRHRERVRILGHGGYVTS
jgi:hypothetical protein